MLINSYKLVGKRVQLKHVTGLDVKGRIAGVNLDIGIIIEPDSLFLVDDEPVHMIVVPNTELKYCSIVGEGEDEEEKVIH